jgi:plastocyanin
MSSDDDSHSHDKEPIILTSPRRLAKGLVIIVAMMAIGAAILIPFFGAMAKNPPPVTQLRTERSAAQQQQAPAAGAGTTAITILQGAAVQGSPDYDPDKAQVPVGNKIVWDNQDTVPHTATSGSGPSDPNNAKLFDTGIITGGEKSNPVEVKGAKQGDTITYHCTVHPYMTGELTITAGGQGSGAQTGGNATAGNATGAAQTGATGAGGAAAGGGPTINILQGASIQGSPDFDPEQLTAKKGDEVTVVNHDTVPHTVTSGTGPSDPNSAKQFNTSIINGGESAKLSLAQVNPGQYDYYCMIHPYMTGKMTVG